jgi:hypothetical protein
VRRATKSLGIMDCPGRSNSRALGSDVPGAKSVFLGPARDLKTKFLSIESIACACSFMMKIVGGQCYCYCCRSKLDAERIVILLYIYTSKSFELRQAVGSTSS